MASGGQSRLQLRAVELALYYAAALTRARLPRLAAPAAHVARAAAARRLRRSPEPQAGPCADGAAAAYM